MTPFSTSIDYPFLKDRILRLWNPTVSSTKVTIATQSPGEGDLCGNFTYHKRKPLFCKVIKGTPHNLSILYLMMKRWLSIQKAFWGFIHDGG
jgi:hypothetical protein